MNEWSVSHEEASIVVVGNFNPSIFHPEWLIRKNIVAEWEYQNDKDLVCLPDVASIPMPDEKFLQVMLERYIIKASLKTEYPIIKDITSAIFRTLSEVPVKMIGMNYTAWLKFNSASAWKKFGERIAPHDTWKRSAPYIDSLSANKQNEFGMVDISMQFPRFDDHVGYIRPRISGVNLVEQILSFQINNHVEQPTVKIDTMLDDSWESSLGFAEKFINDFVLNVLEGDN